MINPYEPPEASQTLAKASPSQRTRLLLVCAAMGTIATVLVYVGDSQAWPYFNRRAGFIGTEFMRELLYAINDPYAIHIVACVWFLYTFLATGLLLFICRILFLRRGRQAIEARQPLN